MRKAREMGDLSENGYYKASRAKLSFLDARLRHLERLVRLGRIIASTQSDQVEIGNIVTVSSNSKNQTYTLVGGYESNPSQKTISHLSPLGRALMGRRVKDTIVVDTPSGTKTFTIIKITSGENNDSSLKQ